METATVPCPAGVGSNTIADLLPVAVAKHGSKRAVMFKDDSGHWVDRSYDEVGEIVKALSLGLIDLGIEKGDKVSILANTRPEWTYFDFAALSAGATVVPIYQTNSPEECQYVLENSDAKAVVVEDDEQLEKIRAVRDRLPEARARDPDDRHERRTRSRWRSSPSAARAAPTPSGRSAGVGHAGRHLHLHLHVGHHRAAEGLRDLARQLPLDARHGPRGQRARRRRGSPTSTCRSPTPSRC